MSNINQQGYERRLQAVRNILAKFGLQSTVISPVEYVENCPFPFNNFIYKVALSFPATAEFFREARSQSDAAPSVISSSGPSTDAKGSVINAGEARLCSRIIPASASLLRGDDGKESDKGDMSEMSSQRNLACVTMPPAEGVSTVIVRLSNPHAEGMNNANRVENEVAAMYLVREALAVQGQAHVIPRVFAWGGITSLEEEGFGWTMMEYMEGKPLDTVFEKMKLQEKQVVVREVASIFSALQNLKLPLGVDSHGGLGINDSGKIVSAEATVLEGGLWKTYEGFLEAKMQAQLRDADSEVIQGWRKNGTRTRIDNFVSGGKMAAAMKAAGMSAKSRALVHGDFTMNNMLYDPEMGQITSLLDFDFSGITHPFEEFCSSFADFFGGLHALDDPKLKQAVLSGDFSGGASASNDVSDEGAMQGKIASVEESEAWILAKTWNEALKTSGALAPSDIEGIEEFERLRHFRTLIAPHDLASKVMIKRKGAENLIQRRDEVEAELVEMLEYYGC